MSSEDVKVENKEDAKEKCVSCEKEFDDVSGLKGHIRRGSCAGTEDPIEAHIDHALGQLEKIIGNDEIKPANVLLFALHLEQIVEQYEELKGPQKKELVLKVFKKYMGKHGGDKYNAMEFLPGFIDVSVSLDKGEATINLDAENAVMCCVSLLSLCANSSKKTKKNEK